MTKIIFRILFVFGGLICLFLSGKPLLQTIENKIYGESVEGRVIGFYSGRNSKIVQLENTGKRNGKRIAKRPVIRYPVVNESIDSLDLFSSFGIFTTFLNYDLDEKVTVVVNNSNPNEAYLFSGGVLFTELLIVLLSIFMLYIGFTGKLA